MQIRHREDDDPPAMFGGSECVGPSTDLQQCNSGIECRKKTFSLKSISSFHPSILFLGI